MPRPPTHDLQMILRYEQGMTLLGVCCDGCGLATVVPLEREPQTDFAWELVRNDIERRFAEVACEPPQVEIARSPSWSERLAANRRRRNATRMEQAEQYWDRLAEHEAGRGPHPDDKIVV